jgi:hypothetical protein
VKALNEISEEELEEAFLDDPEFGLRLLHTDFRDRIAREIRSKLWDVRPNDARAEAIKDVFVRWRQPRPIFGPPWWTGTWVFACGNHTRFGIDLGLGLLGRSILQRLVSVERSNLQRLASVLRPLQTGLNKQFSAEKMSGLRGLANQGNLSLHEY